MNLLNLFDNSFWFALVIGIGVGIFQGLYSYSKFRFYKHFLFVFSGYFILFFSISWCGLYFVFNFEQVQIEELSFLFVILIFSLNFHNIFIHPKIERTKNRFLVKRAILTHNKPYEDSGMINQEIILKYFNQIKKIGEINFDINLNDFDGMITYKLKDWYPKPEFHKNEFKKYYHIEWRNINRNTELFIKVNAKWSKNDNNKLSNEVKIKPENCIIILGNGENIGIKVS